MHNSRKSPRFALALLLGVICTLTLCLVGHDPGSALQVTADFDPLKLGLGLGLAGLVNNRGRAIEFIAGINGVTSGGTAVVNLPTNRRYHRIVLNTTENGSAAAVNSIITGMKMAVNGIPVRDISPLKTIKMAQANGYTPLLGELPIFFTEPLPSQGVWNEPSDIYSWDMVGQNSFSIQLTVSGTVPGVTGAYEYDGKRNLDETGKPFLQAINHHAFTIPIPAGQFDITTLPFNYPIRRLWLEVSTGTLSEVDVFADGVKWREHTVAQARQLYRQCGLKFAQTDYTPFVNATGPAALGVSTAVEAITYFDGAVIFDVDARGWKALQVENSLILRVNNSAAANLTVYMETIPGSFAS